MVFTFNLGALCIVDAAVLMKRVEINLRAERNQSSTRLHFLVKMHLETPTVFFVKKQKFC